MQPPHLAGRASSLVAAASMLLACTLATAPAHAQFAGAPAPNSFHDTSILKPPAGSKAAIVVFEDLECPACAHAHPIVQQASAQYHAPIVRYDFPLKMHVWSFDAAVFARYLQDKVSPKLADDYRTAVFSQQISIGSKDDLQNFTKKFLAQHGQSMPFVVDPTGALANKVRSDYALGERLNVTRTPTVIVVTPTRWQAVTGNDGNDTQSNDINRIFPVLEGAEAQTKVTPLKTVARTSARR